MTVMMKVSLTLILLKKVQPLKQKSRKNDAAIEFYLSRLEEEILSLDKKIWYSNMRKGEEMLYKLSEMIHQLLLKRLINDLVLTFGLRRTTWWEQKNNLMIRKFTKNSDEMFLSLKL